MLDLQRDLHALGVRVQDGWLAACLGHLQTVDPRFSNGSANQKAKIVLQQLLQSDLNLCGAPALPQGVQVGQFSLNECWWGKLGLQGVTHSTCNPCERLL
jgi:hypothetical protein